MTEKKKPKPKKDKTRFFGFGTTICGIKRKMIYLSGKTETVLHESGDKNIPREFKTGELPRSFIENGKEFFLDSFIPDTELYTALYREKRNENDRFSAS